jgi:hypothetical protein
MVIKQSIKMTTGALLIGSFAIAPHAFAKSEVKISGQVSRALTFADNGVDDDVLFTDNTNSGTRFRITGETDAVAGITVGFNIETQYQDNASDQVDFNDSDSSSAFRSRKRELYFQGGFGKLSLGQGDGAANGTSEVDFSGTTIADYSGQDLYDGISFVDSAGNAVVSNGQAFDNFDGLSRNDRIRYDSLNFGPVGFAVSAGTDKGEIAARYSQKLAGGSKVGAAIGYVTDDADDFQQLGLSASYLASNGFNITGAYGEQYLNDSPLDPTSAYIKIGQKLGAHNLSVSYTLTEDQVASNVEAERINLAYVYHLKQGVELFADYENAQIDADGVEDKNLFSIGSRVKF